MAKTGIPREPKIYISLFIVFLILLFMMPRTGKFNYDYKKGSPWAYETLISQIDFPILKTFEECRRGALRPEGQARVQDSCF